MLVKRNRRGKLGPGAHLLTALWDVSTRCSATAGWPGRCGCGVRGGLRGGLMVSSRAGAVAFAGAMCAGALTVAAPDLRSWLETLSATANNVGSPPPLAVTTAHFAKSCSSML